MKPLKLTVRAIRALQEEHGISNLLQPTAEDAEKMACLDFLASFCYQGSRSWEAPPSKEDVEEFEIGAILKAVRETLSGGAPGKD